MTPPSLNLVVPCSLDGESRAPIPPPSERGALLWDRRECKGRVFIFLLTGDRLLKGFTTGDDTWFYFPSTGSGRSRTILEGVREGCRPDRTQPRSSGGVRAAGRTGRSPPVSGHVEEARGRGSAERPPGSAAPPARTKGRTEWTSPSPFPPPPRGSRAAARQRTYLAALQAPSGMTPRGPPRAEIRP